MLARTKNIPPDMVARLQKIFRDLKQHVFANYKDSIAIEYTILGTVPSGKNNTTEGNTRRMASYWRFAAFLFNKTAKIKLIEFENYMIITKGDDCILFGPPYITELWR